MPWSAAGSPAMSPTCRRLHRRDEDRDGDVTQRQVQITVYVEILDQKQGKPLWQRNGCC